MTAEHIAIILATASIICLAIRVAGPILLLYAVYHVCMQQWGFALIALILALWFGAIGFCVDLLPQSRRVSCARLARAT